MNENKTDWDILYIYLTFFIYCYNSTTNSNFNGKLCPFEIDFGKIPTQLECLLDVKVYPVYDFDTYAKNSKLLLQSTSKVATQLLIESKLKSKEYFDKNCNNTKFSINDKIRNRSEWKSIKSTKT